MTSRVPDRNGVKYGSEHIVKVVQYTTYAANVITILYLVIFLARYAMIVTVLVAFVQGVVLAIKMVVIGLGITLPHQNRGVRPAQKLGLVPNVEGRLALLQRYREGQCATIVARL